MSRHYAAADRGTGASVAALYATLSDTLPRQITATWHAAATFTFIATAWRPYYAIAEGRRRRAEPLMFTLMLTIRHYCAEAITLAADTDA